MPDPKSRMEGRSKVKIGRKEAHDTGDPWFHLEVERSRYLAHPSTNQAKRRVALLIEIGMLNHRLHSLAYIYTHGHTCKIFHRIVAEDEHPLSSKKSSENIWVDLVVRAVDGVRSDSVYANKHGDHDHKTPQLPDLKYERNIVATSPRATCDPIQLDFVLRTCKSQFHFRLRLISGTCSFKPTTSDTLCCYYSLTAINTSATVQQSPLITILKTYRVLRGLTRPQPNGNSPNVRYVQRQA